MRERLCFLDDDPRDAACRRLGPLALVLALLLIACSHVSPTPGNEAPTASFTLTPASGVAPLTIDLDASGSSDTDGEIVDYQWSTGDGQAASGVTATFTFTEPGDHGVTLTVEDDAGATTTAFRTVQVQPAEDAPPHNQPPTALFTASSLSGTVPLTIDVDGGDSFDPDGSIIRYQWTVSGDGTATDTGVTTAITFPDAGIYTITLRVTDDDGANGESSRQVQVEAAGATNLSPTARFSASTLDGTTPLTVEVDAGDSSDPDGDIVSYDWAVSGDGSATETGKETEFTFPEAGNYTITLRVTDDDGAIGATSRQVHVRAATGGGNEPPIARFSVDPSSGTVPFTVDVNAGSSSDSDGSIVHYDWTVTGDGTLNDTGKTARFTLTEPGSYSIRLSVTDDDGATDQKTRTVEAEAPSSPPGFQIELVFADPSDFSTAERRAFEDAAERWSEVITGDLADDSVPAMPANYCAAGEDAFAARTLDDLVIQVMLRPIDGAYNAVAFAGPCRLRVGGPDDGLTKYGIMVFDSEDASRMAEDGSLAGLVLHEMGHVLGIGTLWQDADLLAWQPSDEPCETTTFTVLPYYLGQAGDDAYVDAGGPEDVAPVEDDGGMGTRCSHWDEGVLDREVMTGWIEGDGSFMPLSRITVGSLDDLGYTVAMDKADAYSVPSCAPTCGNLRAHGVEEPIVEEPIGEVLIRPVRRDDGAPPP